MAKLKTEVRINDVGWDSDITLVLTDSQAVTALERIVAGEQLNVSLLTSMVAPVDGQLRENPAAYAQ